MKLSQERVEEAPAEAATPAEETAAKQTGQKKPVIIYILILFVVAFMMMAFSLLVHQRSNTEALGQLSDSVSAMQGIQATQEKIIELQESLTQAQEALLKANQEAEALSRRAAASQSDAERVHREWEALTALYSLQQLFAAEAYESCETLLTDMEENGYSSLLSTEAAPGIIPPAETYRNLKTAVEAELSAAP